MSSISSNGDMKSKRMGVEWRYDVKKGGGGGGSTEEGSVARSMMEIKNRWGLLARMN